MVLSVSPGLPRGVEVIEVEKELSEMAIDVNEYKKIETIGKGVFGKVSLCQKGDSFIAAKFISIDAVSIAEK